MNFLTIVLGGYAFGLLGQQFESELVGLAFIITSSGLWGFICARIDIRSMK